mgnify:FL=1
MAQRDDHESCYYLFRDPSAADGGVRAALERRLGRAVEEVSDPDAAVSAAAERPRSAMVFLLPPDGDAPTEHAAPVREAIASCAAVTPRAALYALGPSQDVRGAVFAIQSGVDAYFTTEELGALAAELIAREEAGADAAGPPAGERSAFSAFLTRDSHMRGLFRTARVVAASQVSVLITGETGVGKELFARCIHEASGRDGEFVVENVAGLDDTLFSDALFGHERGAYTGAEGMRAGLIERAGGGTLFLDEIGDITPASQVKLLRLLENGTYYPLGSDEARASTARVVMATNTDLLARVKEGAFRMDLFFRLAAFHLRIPPLRERRHDIPLLVERFAQTTAGELGIRPPHFDSRLLGLLQEYDYPGNVRELQSVVVTLVSHGRDDRLDADALLRLARSVLRRNASTDLTVPPRVSFSESLPTIEELTDQLIDEALRRTDGNQSAAARMLGITSSAVNKRLRRRGEG